MKHIIEVIVLILCFNTIANAQFAGGSGTLEDPYQIETHLHLDAIRDHLSSHFILINDIDLTFETTDPGGAFYNSNNGWEPIGTIETPFKGVFNGNDKTIKGLFINQWMGRETGLFGVISGANPKIENLNLVDVNISGTLNTGGLIGQTTYRTDNETYEDGSFFISNVRITGIINGIRGDTRSAGGIIGRVLYPSGHIEKMSFNGEVTGTGGTSETVGYSVGGIIGSFETNVPENRNILLTESYSIGTFSSGRIAGGLTGINSGIIINSYTQGTVSAPNAGALSYSNWGTIQNSFSATNVTAGYSGGGSIGRNGPSSIAQNIYSTIDLGNPEPDNNTISSVSHLANSSTFQGWDFDSTWTIIEGLTLPWLINNPQKTPTYIPPDIPELISPAENEGNIFPNATFSWRSAERAETYRIQFSKNPYFSSIAIDIENLTDTVYTVNNLELNTEYYWRVGAYNDAGRLGWSESFFTTTPDIPGQFELEYPFINQIVSDTPTNLYWYSLESEPAYYQIQISEDSSFSSLLVDSLLAGSGSRAFTISDLQDQKHYFWRVRGVNPAGAGPFIESSFFKVNSFLKTNNEIVSGVSQFNSNTFYVGSKDQNVYAFDSLGNTKWKVEIGSELSSTVAVDTDGAIYFGGIDKRLYAFDKDGLPLWDKALGGAITTSPTILGKSLYLGLSTGRFFSIEKKTGEVLWSVQTGDEIVSSAAVDEKRVYFGSKDGKLYAISKSGDVDWTFTTSKPIYSSPALTKNNDVVIASTDGKVYKINEIGSVIWEFETQGSIDSSPVINSNGTIIVGSNDGFIYAISEEGDLLWKFLVESQIFRLPVIHSLSLDSFDNIFIAPNVNINYPWGMIVLSPKGELFNYFRTKGGVIGYPLLTNNMKLFIPLTNGNVLILDSKEFLPKSKKSSLTTEAQWPTFKGNYRRTGYINDKAFYTEDNFFDRPDLVQLAQNYPNPFNPITNISYNIPETGIVSLKIFNMLGQEIQTLVNETRPQGVSTVSFLGTGLSSGVYFYRLEFGETVISRKMLLIK